MIASSDHDPFDNRCTSEDIPPNRPFVKVCSFVQTAVDDPAKISDNLMGVMFCWEKIDNA